MDEQIRSELNGGLENIEEMFESCKVRGEQFTRVAVAAFDAGNLFEMYLMGCSLMASEGDEEVVEKNGEGITSLLGSIMQKVGYGMDAAEFHEAIKFGNKVHDQKLALQTRIEKIVNKKG